MHVFCGFFIVIEGFALDQRGNDEYLKQLKYVPLNPKGTHTILTWQEMHAKAVAVSLDHDRVFDVVMEGM
jgi:hypothetical protein